LKEIVMERRCLRFVGLCLALLAMAECAVAASVDALVRDAQGKPVADAVVLAHADGRSPPLQPTLAIIDQVDKEFVPFVKVIVAGSSVSFPNKDAIRHQVYSFSSAKTFELPLYAGTPPHPVLFDKPGVVTLGCNIHDWMLAYVYVADTPYFALSGADGKAQLKGLPQGEYRLSLWHPRLDAQGNTLERRVSVTADTQAAWSVTLKPDLRPRRAPSHHGGGYR
jgi:plastocyanin